MQWGTGAEQTRLRYNANGNLQQQSYAGQTRTHRYDATDRLVGIGDEQGSSARYAYDPLGRRIRKTVGTAGGGGEVTTWYVYSDEGLIAELDGQGVLKRSYGWVPDAMWGTAPLWQAEASTGARAGNQSATLATADYHYLHTDHLGTP
ncbi:RHS repeat domain-containing protein [Xylophilus sp. Leaf220]|uniref:RHS repeat domain-containing protein n=1 Tax=Xylophilus sp. Leaf220 TaxID=1735686 RepID=UPI0006F54A2E|nr:RHS repeat domain-containing protein [Xylophilus sp. Leaf220]KQM78359.1 hypothetical protein ASE76_16990 [Xylophilus sp. Leaf220]